MNRNNKLQCLRRGKQLFAQRCHSLWMLRCFAIRSLSLFPISLFHFNFTIFSAFSFHFFQFVVFKYSKCFCIILTMYFLVFVFSNNGKTVVQVARQTQCNAMQIPYEPNKYWFTIIFLQRAMAFSRFYPILIVSCSIHLLHRNSFNRSQQLLCRASSNIQYTWSLQSLRCLVHWEFSRWKSNSQKTNTKRNMRYWKAK